MINPSSIDIYTAGIAGVVVIGFIGDIISKRTGFPSIVWLLAFGIILGPVFGVLSKSLLIGLSPIVSTLVLLIVIFNAGLRLNIYQFIRSLSRTSLLAVFNFIMAALAAILVMLIFKFNFIDALLMGVIVGGTSAAVIPLISKEAKMSGQARNLVTVESILTDPIGIVLTLAIINIILLKDYSISFAVSSVVSSFSIAIVLGVIAGLVWVPIMGYLQKDKYEYSYAGSISVAFLIFIIVQYLNGSGPIAALVFGIIVSNGEEIFKWFRYKDVRNFTMTSESKRFNNLITFFTSAFFFVYLGALVSFTNIYAMIIGGCIAAALIIARFISTPIALARSEYTNEDKTNASYMVSRGMGAGVLATLPIAYGISGTSSFINIIFIVIVATIVFNSAAALITAIKDRKRVANGDGKGQNSKPAGAQTQQTQGGEPSTKRV